MDWKPEANRIVGATSPVSLDSALTVADWIGCEPRAVRFHKDSSGIFIVPN